MSEKRHKINKFANYQNIIVTNSPVVHKFLKRSPESGTKPERVLMGLL